MYWSHWDTAILWTGILTALLAALPVKVLDARARLLLLGGGGALIVISLITVSYTHLDVYKRQTMGSPTCCVMACGLPHGGCSTALMAIRPTWLRRYSVEQRSERELSGG